MGDISKNFSMSEFVCHDGTPVPVEFQSNIKRLVEEVLQPIRDMIGSPIHIVSGFRTPSHNLACGGVKHSQHLVGKAADIRIESLRPKEVNALVRGFMIARHNYYRQGGGVGWYKNFTHVDIRDGKKVGFWSRT